MVGSPLTTALLLISLSSFCVRGDHHWNKSKELFPECGATNPNDNFIDQSEPEKPGPFHDLTSKELRKLREFLENDPNIRAQKSSNATLKSSYIFTAELHLPKKKEVLKHLDLGGPQPNREALVIMFRGDKTPPVVEEYLCGPLPDVAKCELMNHTSRRNPVEFSVRPLSCLERVGMKEFILKKIDEKVGDILMESYGEKFTQCVDKDNCLVYSSSPVGTGLVGDIKKRLIWMTALYKLPYKSQHILDFSILVDSTDSDASLWTVEKVWYSDKLFDSLEDLLSQYSNNSISKTKVTKPINDQNLFSSLHRRGDFQPPKPQRPPILVEPDGKRYTVKNKEVIYMGWTFKYRLSPLTGPAIYDIRYKGERIVYELALKEIAELYSGHAPFAQTLNEVDNSLLIGSRSKALIPGADCPESATLLSSVFMSQCDEEPAVYDSALCLFENSDGHAMRRHLAYSIEEGGFYGGMLDTQLILRTIVSITGKDYIIDMILHQNGVIHARFKTTGYTHTTFISSAEKMYGHHIHDNILGSVHHTLVQFKVDIDVHGPSNRYETLTINKEKLRLTALPDEPYSQTRINSSLKTTEKEAVFDFEYSSPRYHIIHNNDKRNKYNESMAYRVDVRDISKNLVEQGLGNEKSLSWARHQIVVTKHKDEESSSSSIYGMFDSQKPVADFSSYYEDDEDIVDEDLVFWVTSGIHQIPHSEDIPNAPGVGNHLNIFMSPYNYFPECPSIGSRDAIYIDYKDPKDPSKGVKVDRNGNSRDQCVIPKSTLEEELEDNPDRILESRRRNPTNF